MFKDELGARDYLAEQSKDLESEPDLDLEERFSQIGKNEALPNDQLAEFEMAHFKIRMKTHRLADQKQFDRIPFARMEEEYTTQIYKNLKGYKHENCPRFTDLYELESCNIELTGPDGQKILLDLMDILPEGLPVIFRNIPDNSLASACFLCEEASFVYLDSPPVTLVNLLVLLHEVGHYYSYNSLGDLERFCLERSRGFAGTDNPVMLATYLQDERNSTAFALTICRRFLFDKNFGSQIKPEEVIKLMHQNNLRSHEQTISNIQQHGEEYRRRKYESKEYQKYFDPMTQLQLTKDLSAKIGEYHLDEVPLNDLEHFLNWEVGKTMGEVWLLADIALKNIPNQQKRIFDSLERCMMADWELRAYKESVKRSKSFRWRNEISDELTVNGWHSMDEKQFELVEYERLAGKTKQVYEQEIPNLRQILSEVELVLEKS